MNKTFKLVFNRLRGRMMVVNEMTKSIGAGTTAAATLLAVGSVLVSPANATDSLTEIFPKDTTIVADHELDTQLFAGIGAVGEGKKILVKHDAELKIIAPKTDIFGSLFGLYVSDTSEFQVKGSVTVDFSDVHSENLMIAGLALHNGKADLQDFNATISKTDAHYASGIFWLSDETSHADISVDRLNLTLSENPVAVGIDSGLFSPLMAPLDHQISAEPQYNRFSASENVTLNLLNNDLSVGVSLHETNAVFEKNLFINAESDRISFGLVFLNSASDLMSVNGESEPTFPKLEVGGKTDISVKGPRAIGAILASDSEFSDDVKITAIGQQSIGLDAGGFYGMLFSATDDNKTIDFRKSVTVNVESARFIAFGNIADTTIARDLNIATSNVNPFDLPEYDALDSAFFKASVGNMAVYNFNRLAVDGNINISMINDAEDEFASAATLIGIINAGHFTVGRDLNIRLDNRHSDNCGMLFQNLPDSGFEPSLIHGNLNIVSTTDGELSAGLVMKPNSALVVKGDTAIYSRAEGDAYAMLLADGSRLELQGKNNLLVGDVLLSDSQLILSGKGSHTVIDGDLGVGTAEFTQLSATRDMSTSASSTEPVLVLNEGALSVTGQTLLDSVQLSNASLEVAGESSISDLHADHAIVSVADSGSKLDIGQVDHLKELTLGGGSRLNDETGGDFHAILSRITIGTESIDVESINNLHFDAGEILGEITGTINADGNIVRKVAKNVQNQAKLNATANVASTMTRIQMNELRKRLGDIRVHSDVNGVWARVNAGDMSGDFGLDTDFQMIQGGYDRALRNGQPRVGAAFSYAKTDSDDRFGSAESDAWTLAGYGVWTWDNGLFADVIARAGMIDTTLKQSGETADIDGFMWSVSGEFGTQAKFGNGFFVEPSAEFTYTRIEGDDFMMRGVQRSLDDTDSLIGRFGAAVGMSLPNNIGNAYLRANLVHEFMGNSAITSWNHVNRATEKWTGEETWVEYAVGANLNLTENTHLYADLERTDGASIDEDWRANVGFRLSF